MVVLIDNAPTHTSNAFLDNIEKREKQNLFIQNIPAYSPGLNKIEILWRKIKYEWLDFSAYESFAALKDNLNNILANIGGATTLTLHRFFRIFFGYCLVLSGKILKYAIDRLLSAIASIPIGQQNRKVQPRAITRRPKAYPLLTEPRDKACYTINT